VTSISGAAADIFVSGGDMGALMRSMDWSRTPVGSVETWPSSLKALLRLILSSESQLCVLWGPDLIQFYNDGFRHILGSTKHPQAMGQPARECWSEVWDVIEPMYSRVLAGGSTSVRDGLLVLDRHGFLEECYFDYTYTPLRGDASYVEGILAICTEVTDRVLGERRLRVLSQLSAGMLNIRTTELACRAAATVLDGVGVDIPFALIYLLDTDGRQASLAGAAGLTPGGTTSPASVDLDPRVGAQDVWSLGRAVREGPEILTDLTERLGDLPGGPWPEPSHTALVLPITQAGQARPAGVLVAGVSPRRILDDAYRGLLDLVAGQIAAGVADARAYEAERTRAEALAELDRAKTAFFSNVSHEFRTPLTLMLGPLEDTLAQADSLSMADRERLSIAHRNAVRLLRLVNSLLDFSRIEAGRIQASYEPTDLPRFTADLASTFRSALERGGLRLIVACPPLPPGVRAYVDREMWEKVVLNLLSNAFKFTFDGEIEVALRSTADHLVLTVRDTGAGIPADELPRVFERFHRVEGTHARTQEGTGIGLALVQELVKLHGGQIQVDSTMGHGTTFTVTIPTGAGHLPPERIGAARMQGSTVLGTAPYLDEVLGWLSDETTDLVFPVPSESVGVSVGGARPRVLLADDNRDMRDYVVRLLRPAHEVEAVTNGDQALAAARAHPPDLILSDVMMPGLDGFGLVAALRADPLTRDVPIILLSARAGEEARIDGVQAGADDYLVKPFSAKELLARVEGRLDLARLRARARQQEAAAREQLESLFIQAPAAICLLRGPEHVYTLANTRYRELIGGRDVLGKPIREALPELEGQGIYELLDRVYMTGEPHVGDEVPLKIRRHDDGQLDDVFFDFIYAPIRDADGRVEAIFVHAYEITDQVRARLVAEAATRARDEFLSIASHELRNPIAGIKGTAQLLRRSQQHGRLDADRLERYLASIEAGSNRLTALTEDVLDVTRLEQGELPLRLQETDLVALIQEAVSRLPDEARQHVRVDLAPGIEPIVVDPDRVEQIVVNLLDNAGKYSPQHEAIQVSLVRDAEGLLARFQDHGIGLPASAVETIFEPFGRAPNAKAANIPGLGLGLYICRQIAHRHGGRLWAESDGEGRGTTLCLWLPSSPPATRD
jgi:signal transduction histidine kinase/DNA-binding response OmpR family regulator